MRTHVIHILMTNKKGLVPHTSSKPFFLSQFCLQRNHAQNIRVKRYPHKKQDKFLLVFFPFPRHWFLCAFFVATKLPNSQASVCFHPDLEIDLGTTKRSKKDTSKNTLKVSRKNDEQWTNVLVFPGIKNWWYDDNTVRVASNVGVVWRSTHLVIIFFLLSKSCPYKFTLIYHIIEINFRIPAKTGMALYLYKISIATLFEMWVLQGNIYSENENVTRFTILKGSAALRADMKRRRCVRCKIHLWSCH